MQEEQVFRPAARQAPLRLAAEARPIVKPLAPAVFLDHGTNAEMRWDALDGPGDITPNDRFFVRNHTATPHADIAAWRLRVHGGGLDGPGASFTYDELRRLPERELVSAIECAGNGRRFFGSQQGTASTGTPWALGAIGVARWRGVALAEVLERAGLGRRAVDVMASGLDAPVVSGGIDNGRVRRPIPIAKALDDALLAYEMNGEPLPPDHGFPLRLIVPGWVGVANIKWVGDIEVADRPLFSFWNTHEYVLRGDAYPEEQVLTTQVVKSAWALAPSARLPASRNVRLSGRAWSGAGVVRKVDVSVDRGATWAPAVLHGSNHPGSWVRFEFELPALPSGRYELWARATDDRGATQPLSVPHNTGGYLFGAVVRHPVVVR
jgi:DMSO/TMAO reductase YedYZ molybdopterin-dependent catalytic subunit